MYGMYIFWSLRNYGKHGNQLFCDILSYYFVIVLQEFWDHIDNIDNGLFISSSFSILTLYRRCQCCVIAFMYTAAEEVGP